MIHQATKSIELSAGILGQRSSESGRKRPRPSFERSADTTDSVYEFSWRRFWLFAAAYVLLMLVVGVVLLGAGAALLWILARLAGH